MLAYVDVRIAMPENQQDFAKSQALAEERAVYEAKLDELTEHWEALLEEQEALEEND